MKDLRHYGYYDGDYRHRDRISERSSFEQPDFWGQLSNTMMHNISQYNNEFSNVIGSIVVLTATLAIIKKVTDHNRRMQMEEDNRIRLEQRERLLQAADKGSIFGKSAGYNARMMADKIHDTFQFKDTDTYKHMSHNARGAYAKYKMQSDEHTKNYAAFFASHDARMEDCTYYDKEGKKIEPFKVEMSDMPQDKAMLASMTYGVCIEKAVMHGLDTGDIKCILPDGHAFNPASDIGDRFDSKLRQKFAKIDAKFAKESFDKFKSFSEYDLDKFAGGNLSPEQKNMFVCECGANLMASEFANDIFASMSYDECAKKMYHIDYLSDIDMDIDNAKIHPEDIVGDADFKDVEDAYDSGDDFVSESNITEDKDIIKDKVEDNDAVIDDIIYVPPSDIEEIPSDAGIKSGSVYSSQTQAKIDAAMEKNDNIIKEKAQSLEFEG